VYDGRKSNEEVDMKPAFISLALFLFSSSLATAYWGQEIASQTCTIEGKVVAAATGMPLGKAWIMLRKAEGRDQGVSTRTNAGGKFTFKDLEPGRYRLSAVRNGYVRQEYGQRRPDAAGTTLSLAPGQTMSDVVFRLIRAAIVAGRVYDEDGEPGAEIMVQVMRRRYSRGKRELMPAGMDRTDDQGQYRIFGLAPGQYFVSATPMPGFVSGMFMSGRMARPAGDSGNEEGYSPTFYPGTLDSAQATPLQIRAGEEASAIDFTLMSSRAVRIRGRVFNAVTGQPGRGAWVVLFRRESVLRFMGPGNTTTVEDPEGTFELSGVTPGSYELHARWSDGEKQYSTRVPLDVGTSDVDGINLVIAAGVDVSGQVRVEGDGEFDFQNLRVQLEAQEQSGRMWGAGAPVRSDKSFTLSNVFAGNFRLRVSGLPDDYYLKSARFAGYDVLEEGIKIVAGQVGGNLELVISPQGGHIEGAVVDENQQPVQAATVVLIPDPPRRDQASLYVTATTDQYGRYSLRGITPGDYKVFSWKEVESGAYQDPEFLKPYEDLGKALRVQESDRLNLQLQLIPNANASY
jgi:protocatechuate 3,4-dioxygenase beta subunit